MIGRGGSAILAPDGSYLAGPLYDEEGILYAELDPAMLLAERQRFDPVGHYSRPDVLRAQRSRARCDAEYTSFRAISPSLIGKTSTPSHSSVFPSFSTFASTRTPRSPRPRAGCAS